MTLQNGAGWFYQIAIPIIQSVEAINDYRKCGQLGHDMTEFEFFKQTYKKAQAEQGRDRTQSKDKHHQSTIDGTSRTGRCDGKEIHKSAGQKPLSIPSR